MAFPLTSHPTISLAHVCPRKPDLLTRAYSSFPNSRKKKLRMNCLFAKKDIFGTGVKNWVKKGHSLNVKTYKREIILLTPNAFSSEMMKWEYWRLIPMTTVIGEISIQHIKPYIPSYRLKKITFLFSCSCSCSPFFFLEGGGGIACIITRNLHFPKKTLLFKSKQCLERCNEKRTRNFALRHFTPTPTVFMNYVISFSSIRPFSQRI